MDNDMLKDFVAEALELATQVEAQLLDLERYPDDKEILNAVFRAFHTIKGGAGFIDLPSIVSSCHLTENLFDALRTGQASITPLAIEAALQAHGFIVEQLNALAESADPHSLASMPSDLKDMLTQAMANDTQSVATTTAQTQESENTTTVSAPDWHTLYQAVCQHKATNTPEPILLPDQEPLQPKRRATDHLNRRASDSPPNKEDSIRIDTGKLEALLEVAGESLQAANQAAVILDQLQQFKFEGTAATLINTLAQTLDHAARYTCELQRATLATRMQPIGRLFQKFPRLMRGLAKDLGKEVDLMIFGAETEVDRVVVDSFYEPLVHMLRNSLDHGIEIDRAAVGKPHKAVIALKAWQEANSVIIEIADDGKGMDPQVLRNKAISKGLISEHQAQSVEEALQLIFLPGFSTQEVASNISGRGVGMDVVKTIVEKYRGDIRIDSKPGIGTRFIIRLPIALSIVPTMLVRAAGIALALPIAAVERVVKLPDHFEAMGGAPILRDQGRPLPVRSLAGVLGYQPGYERLGIIMAVPHPYSLSVEVVEGAADLVIKPLTAIKAIGITGTARSAAGELVLVVGLPFLSAGCVTT